MRRHLLRPDAHQEERGSLVWVRHRRCEHGGPAPCPWPGCSAGVEGDGRAVVGPYAVRYFVRHRELSIQHGHLVEAWSWVERNVVNLAVARRSA